MRGVREKANPVTLEEKGERLHGPWQRQSGEDGNRKVVVVGLFGFRQEQEKLLALADKTRKVLMN